MNTYDRTELVTRDTILKFLSDAELSRVANAEAAPRLADGDEYIDLKNPDEGIRRANGRATAPMGDVLPRKAVGEHTWGRIVALVSRSSATRPPARGMKHG